jgi:di/tripeptidase
MLETTLKYFKEIAEIPRCSFKEERIRKYFITWAKEKKYDYNLDNV